MDYRKIILPPVYGSLERSQKAAFLHYTLIIGAAALIIFGFLNLTWGAITLGALLLGISGFCIVGIILNKTNRYNLAAILYSALIFIAIFYNLIDGAALHDPGIAALPIFLILISIFFRRSTIFVFTLVSILGIISIYFFWNTGLLNLSQPPTLNRVIVLSILQVVTGLLSWMIVSLRRETIDKLDWSEESFHALFMAAPIGIGVTSIDGRVLIYNESLIKMGGWNPDEFKLLRVQDYYANPEHRIEMLDILEAAGIVRGYETQFLRKDKSIFHVNMSVIPINYSDEDAFLTILEDISERKQVELVLQEEMEFRRLLVDASPIFFTVVNRQGQTTMMNISMLGALGYEWEEIREVDYIKTFVPEREQSAVLKVIEEEFEHIKTPVSENHILTKTGQELLVEWHACPIINSEDKIEFIFAYGVDITERKRGEEAALEERQRLAHELHDAVSQTLFSASTIAQTLERTWDDNPDLVRQNLGELQILTQGALAEMRNLLLELRPGALEHIPMPDLLRQLVEGFSGRTKTEIELSISRDYPLSYNVRFVFFRLAQEALNNIIKHARANQVQVNYGSQPDQVQLIIEDDGRGFDPSLISPGHHGLEIMKERAGTINATLHIKSQVDGGTKVSIIWQPREVPR